MPRKRNPRPKPPVAEESAEGVTVTYPDRVLPPALTPLKKKRHCPHCGAGPVPSTQRYGSTKSAYLYECDKCVDPETCNPSRWQEPRG